jgi:hypothetical protein
LNLYGYVANNPINKIDPLGLWGVQFGNVNIGWGNPNYAFDNSSWNDVANGAAAVADGLLPQPYFQDLYQNGDPFDPSSGPYSSDYNNALNAANSVGWAIAEPLKGPKPSGKDCPPKNGLGNQPMMGMMGENGTQLTSKTVWKGQNSRLDVENPAPGERPGQLHYQDTTGSKYLYDPGTDSFPGAPNSVNNLLNNPNFRNGIQKGLRYLGEIE